MRDYDTLIRRISNISRIQSLVIGRLESGHPIYGVTSGTGDKKVILSSGIHGDEPAGVEAILRFLEGYGDSLNAGIQRWEKAYQFTVFPCTNPTGYERGTRENACGIDLNRRFGSKKGPPEEVAIIQRALKGQQFVLYMDFHEDTDGEGFYLYEVLYEEKDHLAEEIIESISHRYPIDLRESIDGFPNCGGVICPQRDEKRFPFKRVDLPLPLYLYLHGVRHCFTIESPTRLPMEDRVGMHLMALETVLNRYVLL